MSRRRYLSCIIAEYKWEYKNRPDWLIENLFRFFSEEIRFCKLWHKHKYVPETISITHGNNGIEDPCYLMYRCKCGEWEKPWPAPEKRKISIREAFEYCKRNDPSWQDSIMMQKTENKLTRGGQVV
jgi:hypothetical protein